MSRTLKVAPIATVVDTPATGDPGDDTARRYRYQYEYTAGLLCSLIEEGATCVQVFCEFHEDVVVRYADGQCCGVQVKTRTQGQELWKATDDDVIGALAKFAKKDHEFPGQFSAFRLITNHQFWTQRANSKNVPFLISLAHRAASVSENRVLAAFVRKIAKRAELSEDAVLATLKKTEASHEAPKFRDSLASVSETLRNSHRRCGDASAKRLRQVSQALADKVFHAASLHHEQALRPYMILARDPTRSEQRAKIDGKTFDRERVLAIVDELLDSNKPVLLGIPSQTQTPNPMPSGEDSRLHRKLSAGDLSATTQHTAIDCWASALHQHVQWMNRLGPEDALARHAHVRSVVLSEASAAHESTARNDRPFGREMLEQLRLRIHQRRQTSTELFGLDDEHLLGYAFMLTDECKVWWSTPFEL